MNTDTMIAAQAEHDMRMPPNYEPSPLEEAIAEVCQDTKLNEALGGAAELTLTLCRNEQVRAEVITSFQGQPTVIGNAVILAGLLRDAADRLEGAVR